MAITKLTNLIQDFVTIENDVAVGKGISRPPLTGLVAQQD